MSKRRYYNSTDSSYTMDAQGHALGGGESGEFESSRQITLGLDAGKLIDKGEVEENNSEENVQENRQAPSSEEMVTNTGDDNPSEDANQSEQSGEASAKSESKKSTSRRGRAVSEKEQS